MPMTPEDAAEVARRHGLSIADAVAIRALTDDPITADTIAAKFATSDATAAAAGASEVRDFTRNLFKESE